jgi:hypothetical protein
VKIKGRHRQRFFGADGLKQKADPLFAGYFSLNDKRNRGFKDGPFGDDAQLDFGPVREGGAAGIVG